MKKILCLTLAMMMIACAACASATSLLGSWQTAESPELTEDRTALFEKAVEGLLGVSYVPVVFWEIRLWLEQIIVSSARQL